MEERKPPRTNPVSGSFIGRHCLSDESDVTVVPSVIVNKRRSIGHARNLIAIIPPGHDL